MVRFRRNLLVLIVPALLLGGLAAAAGSRAPQGGPAAAPKVEVEVRLSEYAIAMPRTLAAGATAFVVHNDGLKAHSLKIEGPGVAELLSVPVQPRKTGRLEVTLQTGKYKVYCPIGSHADKGMTTALTVTSKPAG